MQLNKFLHLILIFYRYYRNNIISSVRLPIASYDYNFFFFFLLCLTLQPHWPLMSFVWFSFSFPIWWILSWRSNVELCNSSPFRSNLNLCGYWFSSFTFLIFFCFFRLAFDKSKILNLKKKKTKKIEGNFACETVAYDNQTNPKRKRKEIEMKLKILLIKKRKKEEKKIQIGSLKKSKLKFRTNTFSQ